MRCEPLPSPSGAVVRSLALVAPDDGRAYSEGTDPMAARWNPTHRCGHMGKSMPDTASARAYAAETVEPVDCWQCERMAHGLKAVEMARMLGLPDMQGKSESQETFARDVRERIRQDMESEGIANEPAADALLYGITDARWWLDRKDAPAADVIAWIKPVVDVALSARS